MADIAPADLLGLEMSICELAKLGAQDVNFTGTLPTFATLTSNVGPELVAYCMFVILTEVARISPATIEAIADGMARLAVRLDVNNS